MSTLNEAVEKPEVEGRKLSIAEALREALREEMQRDERVILLGEDIGIKGGFGGAFTVTLGLSDEFGSHRVLDTPISEAGFTGIAIGAALGSVWRLSISSNGSVGQPRRQDALYVRWKTAGPHGDACAGGGHHPGCPTCSVAGVVLYPCAGAQGGLPVNPL